MQKVFALMILSVGILFLFSLRGEPMSALRLLLRKSGASGGLPPYSALCTALCGTLGVGSVGAVVSALAEGGPGVLIWLWVGALPGCWLKYAEITVTMRHRKGETTGPMAALEKKSPAAARIYALLCLPVSLLGMGNLAQVQVLSASLPETTRLPRPSIALIVLAVLCLLLAGGIRSIGRAASAVLPAVGCVYILACLHSIWMLRSGLPALGRQLLCALLHPDPSVFALGIARGLFISEAGMGTAAFAHGASRAQPRFQGALGVLEVLFSTALSTLTALVVLLSGAPLHAGAHHAFAAAMGPSGPVLLCAMLSFFALSTLPVWWFYGTQCVGYLSKNPLMRKLYTALFLLTAFFGCLRPLRGVWALADAANLLLTLPALSMLLLYRRELTAILPNRAKRVILKSSEKNSFLR